MKDKYKYKLDPEYMELTIRLNTYLVVILLCVLISMYGSLANTFAVSTNYGKMPVLINGEYDIHESPTHFGFYSKDEVNNYMLTDIIVLQNAVWSIGDFLIIGGFVALCGFIVYIFILEFKRTKLKKRWRHEKNRRRRYS